MLDGDSVSSTTIGEYNAIWGQYDSAPTTGSTSASLNGVMSYGAYAGHRWYTNGTERMRITSAGNVLVGTTTNTNSSLLVVNGTISETVGTTQYRVLSQYDVGSAPNQVPLNQNLGTMAYTDATAYTNTANAKAFFFAGF